MRQVWRGEALDRVGAGVAGDLPERGGGEGSRPGKQKREGDSKNASNPIAVHTGNGGPTSPHRSTVSFFVSRNPVLA